MKSHLIPEPQPLEKQPRDVNATASRSLSMLDLPRREGLKRGQVEADEVLHRLPEMPLLNFLRVVMAG